MKKRLRNVRLESAGLEYMKTRLENMRLESTKPQKFFSEANKVRYL